MRLVKFGFLLIALLVIGSINVSAQKQKLTDWETICVDGIKDGEIIECPGLSRGNGSFSLTRYMTNPTGSLRAVLPLKFIKSTPDPKPPEFKPDPNVGAVENLRQARAWAEKYRPRELEFVDYSPVRKNEDQIWEFRGKLGTIGDESGRDAWLATLDFLCYRFVETSNPDNPNERKKVRCDNGTYEGKMRIKDTKTNAVYTLNLAVVVDFPPPEK